MALTRAFFSCRISILPAAAVLAAVALAAPPAARAGTYDVVACDAAPGGAWGSWSGVGAPAMSWGVDCPTNRGPTRGMWVRNSVNTGRAQPGASSTMTFEAPAGASLASFSAQYSLHRDDAYWKVGLFADGSMLSGCLPNQQLFCSFSTAWPGITSTWALAPGAHKVFIQAACGSAVWCSTQAEMAPFTERAAVRLFSAVVRVRDDSPPDVWPLDGGLAGGDWLRGGHFLGYGAADNVGIRLTRFYVDGAQRDDLQRDCDFTRRVPCSNLGYARFGLDTQALPDGPHAIRVEAVDTAGNARSFTRTVNVDNHAPDAPDAVSVDGGEGWRQTNSFRLGWNSPPSAAPVTVAHYELCNTASGACTTGERRGDGIAAISDLSVPGPGDYTARLWLEDAAGNVTAANRSLPVHVRFDDVAPGEAKPLERTGWIGASEADSVDQEIGMKDGEVVPVSGVAGYSVTTDGSDPDATADVAGSTYHAGALPEGVTTIKARAISGSGIASGKVGTASIRVDRTPPALSAQGLPGEGWQRTPVHAVLGAADQPDLSGAGYVSYRVDSGETSQTPGSGAEAVVSDDGEHTLTYSATDLAGNESAERTATVRVDRTPPELVVFEAPSPDDPRRVQVAASDRTSGVAGGTIELRRLGSDGGWTSLKTTRSGDHFAATIDDEALPRGVYQLRARVTDNAGNESAGDRRRDGSVAALDTATLRRETKLVAGLVTPSGKAKRKCVRIGKKRRCKTKQASGGGALVATLVVPFGQRALARGTLTGASGAPLPGSAIDVYARSAAAGSSYRLLDRVRTDAAGNFAYAVPAGEGRTLRFHYAGSPRERSSHADVSVKVPAVATIRASRRSVRNGQSVLFSGTLQTKPVPRAGKLIDLQAFYRGRWRTFATPRASSSGAWRYSYRFGATRGTTVYRFRAVVRAESAYPYELGYSKTVRVVVTGR